MGFDFSSEVDGAPGGFPAGEDPDLAQVFTRDLWLHGVGVGNSLWEVGREPGRQ